MRQASLGRSGGVIPGCVGPSGRTVCCMPPVSRFGAGSRVAWESFRRHHGAVASSARSALDVGQLLRDLAVAEAEEIDTADVAAAPGVAPALDHTVADEEDRLDVPTSSPPCMSSRSRIQRQAFGRRSSHAVWLVTGCPSVAGYPAGWPGCGGPIRYGRIISLSSCSTMWQCQTNWPALATTVSFHPFSHASGGVGAELATT